MCRLHQAGTRRAYACAMGLVEGEGEVGQRREGCLQGGNGGLGEQGRKRWAGGRQQGGKDVERGSWDVASGLLLRDTSGWA